MTDGLTIERITAVDMGGWTAMRDLYPIAPQTFREWWQERGEKRE